MLSNHHLQDLQTSHTHTHFVWLNIWLKTSPCDFLPFILVKVLYMIWTQIENKKKQLSLPWHLWLCDTLCSTQTAAGCSWKESWRHFDAFLSMSGCLEDDFIGSWQQKHAVRKQDEFLLTWVFNSYVRYWLTFPQTVWQFELIESSV